MKNIFLFTSLFLCLNFYAQEQHTFKFGVEYMNGKLPEISSTYLEDSYSLSNYPTLQYEIKDDEAITELDLSAFSYAILGILSKDSDGKRFPGYNNSSFTDKYFNPMQNRNLVSFSRSKFKSENFLFGKQIGLDYFGYGPTKKKLFIQGAGVANPSDPGPYFSRTNLYLGLNFYLNKDFGEVVNLKIGSTVDGSISLGSFGLHASPKAKLTLHAGFLVLFADINYDVDYYYAPTQSYYKNPFTHPEKSALATDFRINFGIGLRTKK